MKSILQLYNSHTKYCNNAQHHLYHKKTKHLPIPVHNDFQKCKTMKPIIILHLNYFLSPLHLVDCNLHCTLNIILELLQFMYMYELFLNMNHSRKREKLKWYRITHIVMKWLIQNL